nr:unnamed protein product [Callosobruchus analis]
MTVFRILRRICIRSTIFYKHRFIAGIFTIYLEKRYRICFEEEKCDLQTFSVHGFVVWKYFILEQLFSRIRYIK